MHVIFFFVYIFWLLTKTKKNRIVFVVIHNNEYFHRPEYWDTFLSFTFLVFSFCFWFWLWWWLPPGIFTLFSFRCCWTKFVSSSSSSLMRIRIQCLMIMMMIANEWSNRERERERVSLLRLNHHRKPLHHNLFWL